MSTHREHTLTEFAGNLARVKSLIKVYSVAQVAGRRSVSSSDVLRAATVFLHSSLEEVVRNAFLWKLPDVAEQVLNEVPLAGLGTGRPERFLLGKLAAFRGRIVDNVIRESINEYVNRLNLNSTDELVRYMNMVGTAPGELSVHFASLQSLMKRRHQIVHQMDRNQASGVGHHRAQSISRRQVEAWAVTTERFVTRWMELLPD